jgi:hypothetical protein
MGPASRGAYLRACEAATVLTGGAAPARTKCSEQGAAGWVSSRGSWCYMGAAGAKPVQQCGSLAGSAG